MARSAREFVADYIAAMNRHDVQGVAVWNTDYWDINTMRRQIEAGSG
jgi:hypothetical protein